MRWNSRAFALLPATLVVASTGMAADKVVGTLTVNGKPTPLTSVAVSAQTDPADPSSSWLVVLASDVPVAPDDRTPARLAALAAAGKLKAVRVLWHEGFDTVVAVPYYPAYALSGKRGSEQPSIDLERYDKERFEGSIQSKMLGQEWFFQAKIKAAVEHGGVVELEPMAAEAAASGAGAAGGDTKTQMKMELGGLGYEYNREMFLHAVSDANAKAVGLFLGLGMAPDGPEPSSARPLATAVTQCAYDHEAEALEMTKALLAAGAKVDAGAKDGVTPLLDAAQHCKGVEIVDLLIKAGANVNTKAPGGATPLLFAKIFNKKEIEAALRRAGAKD